MPSGLREQPFSRICPDCQISFITDGPNSFRCSTCAKAQKNKLYLKNCLDYKWRLRKLCQMAKNRSIEKELEFNLTPQILIEKWEKQEGKCLVTKIPFDLSKYQNGEAHPYAPSVDRVIPIRGYTKENTRLVIYHLNIALSSYGQEQFEKLIAAYNGAL